MIFFKDDKEDKLKNKLPETEAIGTTGTEIDGGYLSEEYLTGLTGRQGQDVYKDMARADYNLAMCLNAVKNPIRSSPTEIQIEADDENGEIKKLLCERVMSDILTTDSKMLDEFLTFLEQGFYTGEITFQNVVNKPITNSEGKVVMQSYTGIKDIAFRAQNTIEKWITDKNGRLLGVNQIAYGDMAVDAKIMKDSLVHFAINATGSNFEGISMARPAYGPVLRKNKYLKFNAIGIEKYAVPFIVGTMPKGLDDNDKKNFSSALQAVVNCAKSFMRLGDGYTVEAANIQYDPSKVESSIDKEDMRMTRAFLANFLLLGQTGEGSRAVSNDLGNFFINGLEYIAKFIEDAINEQLKRVQIANFGEQSNYAKMKFVGISDRFGKEMATILGQLVSSNIITPDEKLEESIRKRVGVPEMDVDSARTKEVPTEKPPVTLSERVVSRWGRK